MLSSTINGTQAEQSQVLQHLITLFLVYPNVWRPLSFLQASEENTYEYISGNTFCAPDTVLDLY